MSSAAAANPLALKDFSAGSDMPTTQADPARYTLRKKLRAHLPGRPQVWLGGDRRLLCPVVILRYDLAQPQQREEYERTLALLSPALPHVPHLIDLFHDLTSDLRCIVREYISGSLLCAQAGKVNLKQAIAHAVALSSVFHDMHAYRPQGMCVGKVALSDWILADSGDLWLIGSPNPVPITFDAAGENVRGDVRQAALLTLQLIYGVETASPVDLERRLTLLPPALADVLRKASDPDPNVRYASAQWFAHALQAAALEIGDLLTSWSECNASAEPPLAAPILRPVVLAESAAAYNLTASPGQKDWPSLRWARLAHQALRIHERQCDPSRLTALETLDCIHYAHQQDAALQVLTRPEMASGAILADEVGLGKTIEALMICQEMRAGGKADSILIVAPPAGTTQWLMEARRRIRRNANERGFRLYQRSEDATYPLLIVSSATLRQEKRLKNLIEQRSDDLLIVDEAHQCCGAPSDGDGLSTLGRAISRLKRKRTLLLTATPLGNRLRDIVTLADMIRPGIVGTREDIGLSMAYARRADKALAADSIRILRTRLGAVMVRHRRIDNPMLAVPEVSCESIRILADKKMPADKVRSAVALIAGEMQSERVVVFARASVLRERLAQQLGELCPERRVIAFQANRRHARALENLFNEFPDAVIVANDVVAEGMNWQAARCMVHLDMPTTPLAWEQRTGRIYRLGQTSRSLRIIHLVVAGSDEEKVLDLYEKDLGLFNLPIGEAASVLDHLKTPSMRNLETPIGSVLRGEYSERRVRELSAALRDARADYDRQTQDLRSLDDLLFGEG